MNDTYRIITNGTLFRAQRRVLRWFWYALQEDEAEGPFHPRDFRTVAEARLGIDHDRRLRAERRGCWRPIDHTGDQDATAE